MPRTRHTPVLIILGIAFSWAVGAIAAVSLLGAIADAAFFGGVGHYHLAGTTVSASQFLVSSGPTVAGIIPLVIGVALGLRRRRLWSRYVVLFSLPLPLTSRLAQPHDTDGGCHSCTRGTRVYVHLSFLWGDSA